MRKLREVDIRYAKTYDELSQKEIELNKKAELLDAAEDSRAHLESTIRKLQVEVKALRNKVDFLEIERDNLHCQNESQANLQTSQINTLEAVLDSMTREKETSKEHYEKLLEQADAREKALRKELEEQYNNFNNYVYEGENTAALDAQKGYLEGAQLSMDSQRSQEEGFSGSDHIEEISRAVESIRMNIQENAIGSTSIDDVTISSDLQEKLNDMVDQPKNEIHAVVFKVRQNLHELFNCSDLVSSSGKRCSNNHIGEERGQIQTYSNRRREPQFS